jgi:hypothetical protein
MPLDLLDTCTFTGPALPEPFVRFELERELSKANLLPRSVGAEGREVQESWERYRRKLRELGVSGGALRVRHHIIDPLLERLGYARLEATDPVATREGAEHGGFLLVSSDGAARLRVWATSVDEDLDAPASRGAAYRYSHVRIAQRVLLASGERLGLLTNGSELRLLISDPARPDSQVIIPVDPHWKRSRTVPDSYRLLLALATPAGILALPDLVDKARLQQARVTKELRIQARQAVERFVQEILDHPANEVEVSDELARTLWREGLITVYRLLFILKLETSDDPLRSFRFAATSLWRNTFSPGVALAPLARRVLDEGIETGQMLEAGLRALFRMFAEGLDCTEMPVHALGGALFGAEATPLLTRLTWGERAVAHLLDQLLWTAPKRGSSSRERVHYGPLDVEDLGRVYEALLELEPGIATEPMCRLRRQKLEVVVPLAQGVRYQAAGVAEQGPGDEEVDQEHDDDEDLTSDTRSAQSGKKSGTSVQWIEAIPPGRFYLRVGLGRKSTGSFYTPHAFVRFLVQETLGPPVAARTSQDDPHPEALLQLKICDPAMGSGHFLVEACRYLGAQLYEACRLCDERAEAAEQRADAATSEAERTAARAEAEAFRQRVANLTDLPPDPAPYLPSRSLEGRQPGVSRTLSLALCRRLVAVHCLYGVDKNPLAVELAKLSLWLESHAEGLPLTFLDHRLVVGDSLTGPFFAHLLTHPGQGEPLETLFTQGVTRRFTQALGEALQHVRDLQASVGVSPTDIAAKQQAKARLDRALAPFKLVAAAWAGGVMLGEQGCDNDAYSWLVEQVSGAEGQVVEAGNPLPKAWHAAPASLRRMIARGLGVPAVPANRDALLEVLGSHACIPALSYDLTFAEVFYPDGQVPGSRFQVPDSGGQVSEEQGTGEEPAPTARHGFDVVLGNPPWDAVRPKAKEFFASFDFGILDAPTRRERTAIEKRLKSDQQIALLHDNYLADFAQQHRIHDRLYSYQVVYVQGEKTGGDPDLSKLFMERNAQLLQHQGATGVVVPSAFHANAGATGLRRLFMEQMALQFCYSFENRRKLFEIHSSFKFAPVVAARQGPTDSFTCGFYLHDDEWLFNGHDGREPLRYTLDFVRRTGGEYLSLLELQSPQDLAVAEVCFKHGKPFGEVCEQLNIRLGRELHMTDDTQRLTPIDNVLPNNDDPRDPEIARRLLEQGYLVLQEGKTFHQYTDHWEDRSRYVVPVKDIRTKSAWRKNTQFFRLAYRKFAASTNERTAIFNLHPPGVITAESSPTESNPETRSTVYALCMLASANSFTFDFTLRLITSSSTLNYFFLGRSVMPPLFDTRHPIPAFLAHSALRLTCNHAGYEPLWREQVGTAWREAGPPFIWSVLSGTDERWRVRAAIDAVVADAYGLNREQYAHVLATFSHKSYPAAPELCLAAFDQLQAIGPAAFTRQHDPYHDIPLNMNLPQPVIQLPQVADTAEQEPDTTGIQQTVIDFGAAVEAMRSWRGVRRAAEERAEYQVAGEEEQGAGMAPLDRHVILLARVIERHRMYGSAFEKTLGHVKAEKIAHIIEGQCQINLGRVPERNAAGPVDFKQLLAVIARGKALGAFDELKRSGRQENQKGYQFVPLPGLERVAARMDEAFGQLTPQIDALIDKFVGLNTDEAEIVATLYAVWNDLLAAGETMTDKRIHQGFYAWDKSKQRFDKGSLIRMKAWMEDAQIIPTGQAKRTHAIISKDSSSHNYETSSTQPALMPEQAALYEQIKVLLKDRVVITSNDAQAALGLNATAVRPLLKRLVDAGIAQIEGQGRGRRYRLR